MKTINIKTIAMAVASALLLSTTGCSKNDFEYDFKPATERELTGVYKLIEMCSNTPDLNGCQSGKEIEKINFTFSNKQLTITNTGVKETYSYYIMQNELKVQGSEGNKYDSYVYRTSGDTLFMVGNKQDYRHKLTLLKKITKY
ncbi:hypothetical protein [Sphingobacterium daejeonense]|uniref:hypothetical protein n=1 Tax=Sphingobacterium daejeonense TaxID=371142 RepID=UPI0010C5B003|nr:hypothetical protein [Sphingobacterium daejeonense]VTP97796.1 Uncharacterised protein [Sphingobacterium daejeonense]